jgi:type I restriction enzyme S subunit
MSNAPKVRIAGFTGDWEQQKLGDLMNVTSVKRIHQSDWTDYGIRFLRARDIVAAAKGEEPSDVLYISKEKYEEYSALSGKVSVDDLLVTGVGTIGIPYLISNSEPLYFKDGNIIWFQNCGKINGKFFYYSFTGTQIQTFIKDSAGIGTVGTYTIDSGKKTPISLPEIEEQKKLGAFFTNLDNLITLQQREYEKLVSLKSACLDKMFPKNGSKVPELRFAGFTGDWEQRKLSKMGTTFTGLSGKTKEDFGHGDARFVTYMNVFTNPVSDPDRVEAVEIDKSQNSVQYGDVFFTTSSETPEEVGMSSVWLENTDNTYLNSFCFGFRPTDKIDPYYMAYMLRSEAVRKKIIYLAQGISRYNISKNGVMQIEIPLPDIAEQRLVGEYFKGLDNLITLQQRKLEKLKQLKQSMLYSMFV